MNKSFWFSVCKSPLKQCRLQDKDLLEEKVNRNVFNHTLKSYHPVTLTVTELPEGNSTRNTVEMIFKSSWLNLRVKHVKVERVFKIYHGEDILSRFEEYRETVKIKGCRKCSRCMADGNEMLRFHGTTVMCSLNVVNGVIKLCSLEGCNACNILRNVFSYKCRGSVKGIHTTASSGLAHDYIHSHSHSNAGSTVSVRRGMLVCRVIAGHVHKTVLNSHESFWIKVGNDSVSVESHNNNCKVREVFLSDHRAFLPCFLIVYSLK